MARALDDLDVSRQQRDIVDVHEPHDLRLGRVQPQSAGSHYSLILYNLKSCHPEKPL